MSARLVFFFQQNFLDGLLDAYCTKQSCIPGTYCKVSLRKRRLNMQCRLLNWIVYDSITMQGKTGPVFPNMVEPDLMF